MVFLASLCAFLLPAVVQAKIGDTKTWLSEVYDGDGGDGNSAYLDTPSGFTADESCNLYIADTNNYAVRRLDASSNAITTVLGNGQYGNAVYRPLPLSSQLKAPADIVRSPNGDYYVTDRDEGTLRMFNAAGTVNRTVIKSLKQPRGLAIDSGYLYLAETGRNQILRIPWSTVQADTGIMTATSSSPYHFGVTNTPYDLAVDGNNLYVLGVSNTTLTKFAIDGSVAYATLRTDLVGAEGITMYDHDVYFTTHTTGTTNQINKYDPDTTTFTILQNVHETQWYNRNSDLLFCGGKMYILMGGGSSVFRADLDGSNPVKLAGAFRWNVRDGTRLQALIGRPKAFGRSGSKLYLLHNHRFSVLNMQTWQLTYMTGGSGDDYRNGVGDEARMSGPTQFVLSPDGKTIYFADRNNNRIRTVNTTTNEMKTLSGAGRINMFNDQTNGYQEGNPCTTTMTQSEAGCAYFDRPTGIAISLSGKILYVADSGNNRIRKVNIATGKTTFLAGSTTGYKNGTGSGIRFNRPNSLLLSKDGVYLYVVDVNNHVIRKVNVNSGRSETVAGVGRGGYRDGSFSTAVFSLPDTLAWGATSNILYLSEQGSNRIRTLNLTTRRVSTLAGSGVRGTRNGVAGIASFNAPRGLLQLAPNTLLVADTNNDLIRSVLTK